MLCGPKKYHINIVKLKFVKRRQKMERELNVKIHESGDVYINNSFAAQLCFTSDAVGSAVAQYLAENTDNGPSAEDRSKMVRQAVLHITILWAAES